MNPISQIHQVHLRHLFSILMQNQPPHSYSICSGWHTIPPHDTEVITIGF